MYNIKDLNRCFNTVVNEEVTRNQKKKIINILCVYSYPV